MKVIHAELKNYNRRADESVSLKLDSLMELSSNDIAEIDGHRGCVATVVLTDSLIGNELDFDVEDIIKNLPDADTYENKKTPSQRMRGVLYVQCEQKLGHKPTQLEFSDYYLRKMEGMIRKIKETLD